MGYNVWESCFLIPGFSRSECASWAQAISAAAAVIVALFIVILQNHLQVQRERAARNERLQTARQMIGLSIQSIRGLMESVGLEKVPTVDALREMLAVIGGVGRAFSDLRLGDYGPVSGTEPMIKAIAILNNIQLLTGQFHFGGDGGLPGQVYRILEPQAVALESYAAKLNGPS